MKSGILQSRRLKTWRQNEEIKPSKVQTHNFDACFLNTRKTGDGTKQFYGDVLHSYQSRLQKSRAYIEIDHVLI